MSVIRPRPSEDPIVLHVAGWGGRPWRSCTLGAAAKAIQAELKANLECLDLPRSLLDEYGTRRPTSRLFAILGEARRIRDAVDRLVIVSAKPLACVTRLLVASCCHPFHNDLPRGERGGRPRITWLDADADTDRVQGLLDVVAPEGRPRSRDLLDQWAVLAVDAPMTEEAVVARTTVLVQALERADAIVAERLVTIASQSGGRLAALAALFGTVPYHGEETGSDASQAVFTAAALLPASIAGIDIVRFLQGADAMLTRFTEAPVATNPVLIHAACHHRAVRDSGVVGSLCTGGGSALAELSSWVSHVRPAYASLLPLGESDGATPPALVTHVVVDESRRRVMDPLGGAPTAPQASIKIHLPRLDEHALGQLVQLVILSAAVEKRLHETL